MSTTGKSAEAPVAEVVKKDKPTPATHARNKDGSFSIEPPDIAGEKNDTTEELYWCGATLDSLQQTIDVKGISFPRWTDVPQVHDKLDEHGQPQWIGGKPLLGTYHRLTKARVEDFLQTVRRRVLRKIGTRRGLVMNIDRENYRHDPSRDRPLGEVLYMVLESEMTGNSRKNIPTPLISPKE